ncbi:OmpH family outer membrane protein [Olleya aquimaris]|uniref:OmpH family outer membrane protein n=1 Tax=Olleya sediminilitoris TaxID=2795739 RepID=A0ABS1WH85_9FLAO|nr:MULTISPECIES: OmpH family outer membrane protein [Olleya]AXO80761.1 OmpH family outer membrane protein [Olleya aquimaris]MBL7558489.1 OmpH family outer membrane protein [Olleya sediminilitoris]
MKKIIGLVIVSLVFTSCQKQKIAFIDNGEVINKIQEKVDLEASYKSTLDKFNTKRDSLGKAFQMEAQKFQIEAQSMSAKKAQAKYDELGQKQQLLQQQLQYEQQQISEPFQKDMDSLISKVKKYVSNYGKTNGYDYILGTSEAGPSVLFGKEEFDLSKTIIEGLDTEYKK